MVRGFHLARYWSHSLASLGEGSLLHWEAALFPLEDSKYFCGEVR